MDASPTDPLDVHARPVDSLRADLTDADTALRRADYDTVLRLLPGVIGELCVHAATGAEPARSEALKLLVLACGSDGTCTLRHLGETNLAFISGERAQQAADLLGDPIWRGPPRTAEHTRAAR
ncbi:hypothetical protein [Thermocatellispora tengchongensis]|uniref:hypothetical protein n=1 Tax=Thermocatellispora tengchongensis TaxID=1073253 RepID=UPI00362D0E31